jgi:hypothetical protein
MTYDNIVRCLEGKDDEFPVEPRTARANASTIGAT